MTEAQMGRWYMVNKMGMATLCVEKEDAEKEAADAQSVWPHMGPHRAVRLVEASFEAADMATAAAQGFRDGAASIAANAGEPVAHLWQHCETGRTRIVMPDMIVDADASWQVVGPLYLGAAPPTAQAEGWMPIKTAQQDGRTLLLGYFNSAGKWRTTRGEWMSQDYIDEYAEDPDCMSPGWYETTVEGDDGKCWPIDPTHWMPLPPPPTTSAGSGKGE